MRKEGRELSRPRELICALQRRLGQAGISPSKGVQGGRYLGLQAVTSSGTKTGTMVGTLKYRVGKHCTVMDQLPFAGS
jgi:hypothetical protein